jgi:hypothetical protein
MRTMPVDVPNMLVSAFLPEDIFTGSRPRGVARRHRRRESTSWT